MGGALCWALGGGLGRDRVASLRCVVALCVGLSVVIRSGERRGDLNAPGSAPDRDGARGASHGTVHQNSSRILAHCAYEVLSRITRSGPLQSSRERHPLPPHAGPTPALVVGIRARRATGGRGVERGRRGERGRGGTWATPAGRHTRGRPMRRLWGFGRGRRREASCGGGSRSRIVRPTSIEHPLCALCSALASAPKLLLGRRSGAHGLIPPRPSLRSARCSPRLRRRTRRPLSPPRRRCLWDPVR